MRRCSVADPSENLEAFETFLDPWTTRRCWEMVGRNGREGRTGERSARALRRCETDQGFVFLGGNRNGKKKRGVGGNWSWETVVGKGGGRMREERRCGFIARMPEDHAAGSARASNNLRVFSNASWNRAASNSLNSSPFPPSASVSPVPLDPSFRQERRPSCLDRGMCTAECRHANATKKLLTRVVCRGSPVSGQRQRLSISYSFARSFHLSSPLFTPSLLLPFVRSFVRFFLRSFLRSFLSDSQAYTPRETSTTSRTTIVPIDQVAAGSLR